VTRGRENGSGGYRVRAIGGVVRRRGRGGGGRAMVGGRAAFAITVAPDVDRSHRVFE
jgi:hypothetical protein